MQLFVYVRVCACSYIDTVTLKEPECCDHHSEHQSGVYGPKPEVHHNCFPIEISPHDPFYRHHGISCMNFLRSFAGVRPGCRLGTNTIDTKYFLKIPIHSVVLNAQ